MTRVLVISPHPDDESIGCGGAIRKHAARGDAVHIIFLTSGEKGGHGREEEDTRRIREDEARSAAKILGAESLEFYRLPDGAVQATPTAVARLREALLRWRPDYVYVPHPAETHSDHRAAVHLLQSALENLTNFSPRVRMYEIWTPLQKIDEIEDISACIDVKLAAIRAHRSQCEVMAFDEAAKGLNRYRGEMHSWPGGDYAEVFEEWRMKRQTSEMAQIPRQGVGDDSATSSPRLVSVIVNNYNYGRFLPDAIDSALQQRYGNVEVIVVDDGSNDNSRAIIAGYGSRIRSVLKSNGGQASALNAGFAASRGRVVLFLDSDDILFPDAAKNAVAQLAPGQSKVHWPMWIIDSQGRRTGDTRPAHAPPAGDYGEQVLHRGPSNVASSPTSGNAWSREFLQRVMPIPENVAYYRTCADEYLYTLAPVFGEIRTIADPQGCYRVHGDNGYSSLPFRKKLELEILGYNDQCAALHATLARNGIHVDVEEWKRHSWFHRLERALIEVQHWIPENCSLVLIDGETWGNDWRDGRWRLRPFFDVEGIDWGPPAESQSAIERLGHLVDLGVQYLVLAWPSFWWLDEYADFFQYLQRHSTCLASNDAIQIYELAPVSPSKTGKLELRVPAAQGGR